MGSGQPRPSDALRDHRETVREILAAHRMRNPRVFGSIADGNDAAGSDVDLLVDAEDDLDLLDIVDAAQQLEALLAVPVDIVTSRSLRDGHPILATAVPL